MSIPSGPLRDALSGLMSEIAVEATNTKGAEAARLTKWHSRINHLLAGDAHQPESPQPISLGDLERKANAAIGTDHNPHSNWRVDGRTLWSGAGTMQQLAHPLCSFYIDSDPSGMRPPPIGTAATLEHLAANEPHVTLALVAIARTELERDAAAKRSAEAIIRSCSGGSRDEVSARQRDLFAANDAHAAALDRVKL